MTHSFPTRPAPDLRMLRHGDGGLALFNGATEGIVWRIDSLLARAESKARAIASAPDTGFERLSAGRALAIMDTGVTTADEGLAHAGTLAFELSVGKERDRKSTRLNSSH